jgi:hypothetical protein
MSAIAWVRAQGIQEIPNVGRYSMCTDTEGYPFGLYQGQSG